MTIPVGESFEEFTAFFHNRQIRTVIGIKDIINTDFFERADQLAHGRVLILETNLLSPRGTHRRSHLYDGDDFRIRERVVEIQSVISFAQRADRTMRDALPAKRAVAFAEGLIIFEPDGRAVAGTDQRPDAHALNFFADLNAAHAFHTFGSITHQRKIPIPAAFFCRIFIIGKDDAKVIGNRLQRAVSALDAARAVRVVVRKHQFHIDPSGSSDTRTVRQDFHTVFADGVARGHELFHSF